MALYTDSILVLSGGKIQKISASDSLAIGGSITATGGFVGNASTSTKWAAPISIGFSGGAVTGTISSLDGSANVSGVSLSIANSAVTNDMLAGSISDSKLSTISTAGKVANSATTATDANTGNAIVARDASGNFSAGTITASLTGNASTATSAGKWTTARSVTFATGDVTGSFSIDGSADVSNVDLTIANGSVTNDMLAGSISDSKLSTISTAGKVADSALSSNVAKYNDAAPTFANVVAAGGFSTSGDAYVGGDLVVDGSIVSKSQENVLISDSFLDLNAGNLVTATAIAGGLTVNVKASGTAEDVSAFAAGVVSTSAPSFTTTAASAFAAGDIVQISGAAEAKNNGLFVVAGVSGSTVEIKGIGGTAVSANTPFVQNDFVTATSQAAKATKADIAVLAVSDGSLTKSGAVAIAAGTWCFNYQTSASDSEFASSWTPITAATIPTLAQVLTAGSMIGADNEIGFVINVAGAGVKGDLLYIASDGEAKLISTAIADGELDGVALEAGGSNKEIASVVGQKVWVGITGAAPAVGDLLYVSGTAGKAVVAAPTSGRLIKVGKCVGAVGSGANSGLYPVLFQPQYLADL